MISHLKTPPSYFPEVKKLAFVANGVIKDYFLIKKLISSYERVVAVDGGLFYCQQMEIVPDLLVGDLDSVTPELLKIYSNVPVLKFPTEKDDTDLELAIKVTNHPNVQTMGLFGVMGNRVDHALNNLNLISLFPKIIIETEMESIFSITGEKEINCFPGQKISLLPLNSSARGVTTQGLQWELQNAHLDHNFRSISNVCLTKSIRIKIEQGELICCLARA